MLLPRLQETKMRISFSVIRLAAQERSPLGFGFGDLALLLERECKTASGFREQATPGRRQWTIGAVVSHNTPMNVTNLAHFTFLSVQILAPRGGMMQHPQV